MCVTCGCSEGGGAVRVASHDYDHAQTSDGASSHDYRHERAHDEAHARAHENGIAHTHAHAREPLGGHTHRLDAADSRTVALERAVLAKNDALAELNRQRFEELGILALNLVSSPGSGKTSLLERTIRDRGAELPLVVIEGDQATENDSARIRAAGARALQVNTGTGCHLEAETIGHAVDVLAPAPGCVLMIENVGNLVCPALFDLGERAKIAILSVTEGDDKPAKYPHMFAAADLLVINKIDLLPYVDFDIERCIEHARAVRPGLEAIALSAKTGENVSAWYAWLAHARETARRYSAAGSAIPS